MTDFLDTIRAMHAQAESRLRSIEFATWVLEEGEKRGVAITSELDEGSLILCLPVDGPAPERPLAIEAPKQEEPPATAAFRHTPQAKIETQAVAPSPAPRVEQAPQPEKNARSGEPWSEKEDAAIVAGAVAGLTMPEIAARIGRTAAATSYRRYNNLKQRIEQAKAAPEPPPPPSEPKSQPPVDVAWPVDLETPGWLRELRAHLNALGNVEPWGPRLDAELMRLYTEGQKTPQVAAALRLSPALVASRFRALCPEPSHESQARLLAELQRRAAAEFAA